MAQSRPSHKPLLRDLRGADDDIRIFALRALIKLVRNTFQSEETALAEFKGAINELLPSWPEEIQFYGRRALEHLETLSVPEQVDGWDEAPENAPIDLADLDGQDVRGVIKCLRSIEAQVYKEAAPKLQDLLLKATDPLLLAALLQTLGVVGSSSALFAVKQLMDNPNDRVRGTCVDVIAKLAGDPAVAQAMIEPFLQDRDGGVRARAVAFVGPRDFGKVQAAIETTMQSLQVNDRAALAEAVCAIKAESIVPVLKRLSDDPEETVKVKLLEALERADHPQKAFILKKMVKDASPVVRKVAAEALRRYETKRMLSMGGFVAPAAAEGAPSAARRMQALEDIQSAEELDPIELADLKDPDQSIKLQCLHKIRQRTYEKAYQSVIELLGVAENEEILAATLRCLTVVGTNRDVEAIMHFLPHTAATVRAAAAEAINQVATGSQAIFLLLPMLHDPDLLVRGVVARAMLRYPLEELKAYVAKMFTHKAVPIRHRLLGFLGNYGGDAVLGYLARATQDPDPQVRRAVAACCWRQADERALKILERLAADGDESVRTDAQRARAGLEKRRVAGTAPEALPSLDEVLQVAQASAAEAEALLRERERADAELRERPAEPSSTETSGMRSLVGKVSQDISAARELEMMKLNREVILEDMGKKLYRLIKAKQAQHASFDRSVFLLDKYLHLEKQGGAEKAEDAGLWARLSKAAGVTQESAHNRQVREALKRAYMDLGRTAFDLSFKENVIFQELHIDYIELEQVEKKLAARDESREPRASKETPPVKP